MGGGLVRAAGGMWWDCSGERPLEQLMDGQAISESPQPIKVIIPELPPEASATPRHTTFIVKACYKRGDREPHIDSIDVTT